MIFKIVIVNSLLIRVTVLEYLLLHFGRNYRGPDDLTGSRRNTRHSSGLSEPIITVNSRHGSQNEGYHFWMDEALCAYSQVRLRCI